jgi:hypothetical protein
LPKIDYVEAGEAARGGGKRMEWEEQKGDDTDGR